MKTLIELYDERPLENVLGAEMFRPERVVYVCPEEIAADQNLHGKLRAYFKHRGIKLEAIFLKGAMYDAEGLLRVFRKILDRYPDCAIDITGGTDAALFSVGLLCAETPIPAFTYSRRRECYYNIRNAPFANEVPCGVRFKVEDFFLMAGGSMRKGRVENRILQEYLNDIKPFFRLFLRYRKDWTKIITYIQRVSPSTPEGSPALRVSGEYTVKGERASRISAPEDALRDLQQMGFLQDLRIVPEQSVSFCFRDAQVRAWLRDVGSVLELFVYKACLDTGLFDDVILSAVVDWYGDVQENAVTNELDVMCARGISPVFISCKTCDVKTEALNELSVLRDRFCGKVAKAAIVPAERGGSAMRNRAEELNIEVIDLDDLTAGRIQQKLIALIRGEK